MQKFKRILALVLVGVFIALMLPTINFREAEAVSTNVYQSRWVAEVEDFPESYQAGLARIKAIYPNAQFIYYDTDLDWYNDVLTDENEMSFGRNLIPASSPSSWKSTDSRSYNPSTNTYTQVEPGWNNASQEIVEYYMDPRNFFNESDIFQFLDLSFTGTETVEGVQAILAPSFMGDRTIVDENGNQVTYAQALYDIGKEVNVSPYLLACRIRQEQGSGTSSLISGTYPGFEGYYNYFNICASGSTTKAIIENGLREAKESGWNSRYKAIRGGARVLAANYVDAGKNCLYLQHFNMTAHNNVVNYSIYMANTTAPYYENKMMAKSLTDKSAGYTFVIPVYDNMPESPCNMPEGSGNGSYLLKSLSLNGGEVSIGKFSPYDFSYTASVSNASFITLKTTMYAKTSKIAINGIPINTNDETTVEKAIMLQGGFNKITITVTAENGVCRDYVLNIINNDGKTHYDSSAIDFNNNNAILKSKQTVDSMKNAIKTLNCSILIVNQDGQIKDATELCVSGDIIMIKNNENQVIYNATIILMGDINNDGDITREDIALTQAHILENTTLPLAEQRRADINEDGVIDVADIGVMRTLIDEYMGAYATNITITPDVPDDLYEGKSTKMTLSRSSGTYYIEGYLTYNEGRVLIEDVPNDGRIHFIASGEDVVFENGKSYVQVQPIVISGPSEFDIEIIKTYDYSMRREFTPITEQSVLNVKNAELEIEVVNTSASTEGNKNYHIATFSMKNIANTSLANVHINLGQYFVDANGKNEIDIVGMKSGTTQTFKLILVNGLSSANYSTGITIQYQDSDGIESVMQVPITFEILNHEHPMNWKIDDMKHSLKCDTCGDSTEEIHQYHEYETNKFSCVVCGHTREYEVTISQSNIIAGKEVKFTPLVKLNGKDVKAETFEVKWYLNGKIASSNDVFTKTFNTVGNNNVDCVITHNGVVLTQSASAFAQQPSSDVKNPIVVTSISCSSISVKKYSGYEYRIGSGQWQDSITFNNLEPNKTYIVYQRNKTTKEYTSIRVQTSHKESSLIYKDVCGSDTVVSGMCTYCKKEVNRTIPGTAHSHLYSDFTTTASATCKNGTKQTANCVYNCGQKKTIELNDKQQHQFSVYTYDNNSDCVSGGTKTAKCDYGCGKTHIVPVDGEPLGHQYVYIENQDATVTTSKTATGKCTVCGHETNKVIDGTRLIYSEELIINIKTDVVLTELPVVESQSEDLLIKSCTWTNANGVVNSNNPFAPKAGDVYTLSELQIKADAEHAIYPEIKIYINGKLFSGERSIDENGVLTLINVGQLAF